VYATPATVDLRLNNGPRIPFTNSEITNGKLNWMQFSYFFDSPGTTTAIEFYNGTATGTNFAGLDNVSLVVVPEPSACTLLVMGGASLRASRRARRE
jgi:hypothetical protein